jgi:hypothetical protein
MMVLEESCRGRIIKIFPSGEIKLSIDGEKLTAGILLVELMINGEERKSLRLIKAQ